MHLNPIIRDLFFTHNVHSILCVLGKSLKIQNPPQIPGFSLLQPSEMASLSKYRWQNRKESPKRSTNNGDVVEKVKRNVTSI